MAWVTTRPGGKNWIGFRHNDRQYTIRIGKSTKSHAKQFAILVERLASTVACGLAPDPELVAWLERMGDGPRRTLTTAGLAKPRKVRTVKSLCDRYVETLEDRLAAGEAKQSTIDNATVVVRNMLAFWPDGSLIRDITPDDAEDFRRWLRTSGRVKSSEPLSETTVSRRCRRVREILGLAVDRGWIDRNPFRRMKRFRNTNTDRDHYVPRDVIETLIAATTDLEVRLVLSLARYAGLRVPSEIQQMTLADLNIETKTIRIVSPKTAHHDGQAERLSPLWPEIEPHARAVFDAALVGQESAFPNFSVLSGAAITARIRRIAITAGVVLWPKVFVNLRASCERDLFRHHPLDDVCTWMGHSPLVALKHYRRSAKLIATEKAVAGIGTHGLRVAAEAESVEPGDRSSEPVLRHTGMQ